jgi:hypothetical protein
MRVTTLISRILGSVEILNQTLVKGDNAETVFLKISQRGCLSCPKDRTDSQEIFDRIFPRCDKGTRENGHQTISEFATVAGAMEFEDIRTDVFSCSFAVAYRRCPDGHLLQFTLPCGNGKKFEDF